MATRTRRRVPSPRWISLTVAVALVATVASTPAEAIPPAGIITTEYQDPESANGIADVAVSPDGTTYLLRTGGLSQVGPKVSRLNDDGTLTTLHSGTNCPDDVEQDPPGVFCGVVDFAAGPDGNLYVITEEFTFCGFCGGGPWGSFVWRLTPAGQLSLVAGGGSSQADGIPATSAELRSPAVIGVGGDGRIFIAENTPGRIRQIGVDGTITTIAGTGLAGYSGDDGPATDAQFATFRGIAVGPAGEIFVHANARIRRIDTDGVVTTIGGTGTVGYSGDGGPALGAQLRGGQIAVAADGSVFLAGGSRVRVIDPGGIIDTVAGTGGTGSTGDGGPATEAEVDARYGLTFDANGDLLVADARNMNVRRVTWHGVVEGAVGDDGGVPAAGVIVSLLVEWPGWVVVDTVVTDTSGWYRFEGVDPGGYRVRFWDPQGRFERAWWDGDPTYRSADPVSVTIGATQEADVALPAWTSGVLRGQLTDEESGAPLAGGLALVFSDDGYVAGATAGPSGYFHVRGLPEGDYRVRFQGPTPESHVAEWFDGASTASESEVITLGAETVTVDASLAPTE